MRGEGSEGVRVVRGEGSEGLGDDAGRYVSRVVLYRRYSVLYLPPSPPLPPPSPLTTHSGCVGFLSE